jgi:hypothetical protein
MHNGMQLQKRGPEGARESPNALEYKPLMMLAQNSSAIWYGWLNVFYRVTAHDWETDHPRAVFIDPNDLS